MQAMADHFSHHQCTTINYNVRVFKWHRQASDEEVQRLRVSVVRVRAYSTRTFRHSSANVKSMLYKCG